MSPYRSCAEVDISQRDHEASHRNLQLAANAAVTVTKRRTLMHSTWMDPMIKAQHTTRRASNSPQADSENSTEDDASTSDDEHVQNVRSTRGLEREIADWEQDFTDTLPELEEAFGVADWIDPQTGSLAEGQSRLHVAFE